MAFSPDITGSLILNLKPEKNTEVSFTSKNVNRQYLDNTENKSRSLAPYYTQDLRASYKLSYKSLKEINIILQVNNLFNKKYEPNGYTYSYFYGGETTTENYYFPMAGINFMAGLNFRF
ncbi:MAG: TonB-dependent receptor [Chitinophagaceae bacterium]|nr:TonB-dependent receptor [Chitinophagaceae bacterium]